MCIYIYIYIYIFTAGIPIIHWYGTEGDYNVRSLWAAAPERGSLPRRATRVHTIACVPCMRKFINGTQQVGAPCMQVLQVHCVCLSASRMSKQAVRVPCVSKCRTRQAAGYTQADARAQRTQTRFAVQARIRVLG